MTEESTEESTEEPTKKLQLHTVFFDSQGNEIGKLSIDNHLPYTLNTQLAIANFTNGVNSLLRSAGCPRCISTGEAEKMIRQAKFNGTNTYFTKLPKKFNLQLQ